MLLGQVLASQGLPLLVGQQQIHVSFDFLGVKAHNLVFEQGLHFTSYQLISQDVLNGGSSQRVNLKH